MQSERPLDSIDWKILRELQQDARLSFNELGRRVGLSSPAVAERIHRLEESGVVTGYGAQVDKAKIGLPLLAFIQLRCKPGKCLLEKRKPEDFPEIVEMHKLSGAHCSLLKVSVSSIEHLDALNARLATLGSVVPYVVTSSVYTRRVVDWESATVETQPPVIPGWNDK